MANPTLQFIVRVGLGWVEIWSVVYYYSVAKIIFRYLQLVSRRMHHHIQLGLTLDSDYWYKTIWRIEDDKN